MRRAVGEKKYQELSQRYPKYTNATRQRLIAAAPEMPVIKAVVRRNTSVKRTHKGPLRNVLARNMRRLRASRGLSQEALAHECGVNRTYLSAIERSERNVSIDNIARIARGLDVEPWKLLRDT